jgi:hypothetical protein
MVVETVITNDKYLELKKTLDYMDEYKPINVRGSCFANLKLSLDDEKFVRRLSRATNERCYKCGKIGHFAMHYR